MFSLEILRLLLGQLIAVLDLTGQMRKAVLDQLATKIGAGDSCENAPCQWSSPNQQHREPANPQLQTLEAMTGTRSLFKASW